MPLTGEQVAARAHNAVLVFDDDYYDRYGPQGRLLEWPDRSEQALKESIGAILTAYPHLSDSLGYGWTADRAAYRTVQDVELQRYVLELIADVDIGHPKVTAANPVAARMAINRDFISYAQPGIDVDFIFIGRGFMDVLKYFAEMTLDIMDLAPSAKNQWAPWGPANLTEIRSNHPEGVAAAVALFVVQSMSVFEGKFPTGSRPIWDTLSTVPSSLMPLTYDAVESFVVAHELGHLLEQHDVRDASLTKEIIADMAAVSLQAARHGTQKRVYESMWGANSALSVGGPTFYLLGSLYYAIAALVDYQHGKAVKSYFEAIVQLRVRWHFYRDYATSDSVRLSAHFLDKCARNLCQLVGLCLETLRGYSQNSADKTGRPALPLFEDLLKILPEW